MWLLKMRSYKTRVCPKSRWLVCYCRHRCREEKADEHRDTGQTDSHMKTEAETEWPQAIEVVEAERNWPPQNLHQVHSLPTSWFQTFSFQKNRRIRYIVWSWAVMFPYSNHGALIHHLYHTGNFLLTGVCPCDFNNLYNLRYLPALSLQFILIALFHWLCFLNFCR